MGDRFFFFFCHEISSTTTMEASTGHRSMKLNGAEHLKRRSRIATCHTRGIFLKCATFPRRRGWFQLLECTRTRSRQSTHQRSRDLLSVDLGRLILSCARHTNSHPLIDLCIVVFSPALWPHRVRI